MTGFEVQVRPWVAIFFLFSRNAINNRSKFLSKMAATVYERDNCDGDTCNFLSHRSPDRSHTVVFPDLFLVFSLPTKGIYFNVTIDD